MPWPVKRDCHPGDTGSFGLVNPASASESDPKLNLIVTALQCEDVQELIQKLIVKAFASDELSDIVGTLHLHQKHWVEDALGRFQSDIDERLERNHDLTIKLGSMVKCELKALGEDLREGTEADRDFISKQFDLLRRELASGRSVTMDGDADDAQTIQELTEEVSALKLKLKSKRRKKKHKNSEGGSLSVAIEAASGDEMTDGARRKGSGLTVTVSEEPSMLGQEPSDGTDRSTELGVRYATFSLSSEEDEEPKKHASSPVSATTTHRERGEPGSGKDFRDFRLVQFFGLRQFQRALGLKEYFVQMPCPMPCWDWPALRFLTIREAWPLLSASKQLAYCMMRPPKKLGYAPLR